MSSAIVRPGLRSESVLIAAIGISFALHALMLAVHFTFPEAFNLKDPETPLEVILVNAKSKARPVKPTAIAQADLNGGGEHDQGRSTSFLPNSPQNTDGDALTDSNAAVARLEAQQRKLLSTLQDAPVPVDPDPPKADPNHPDAQLEDPAELSKKIARMQAQLDKEINDYNARPHRGFIGPNTRSATYAIYYSQWKDRVERIGTENYPPEARGKYYGELILSVTLKPDGSIYNDEVVVTQSSGYPILDRAAKRIVRLAAPYGKFPTDMRREYDVFEIVTRFSFTRGNGFEAQIERK